MSNGKEKSGLKEILLNVLGGALGGEAFIELQAEKRSRQEREEIRAEEERIRREDIIREITRDVGTQIGQSITPDQARQQQPSRTIPLEQGPEGLLQAGQGQGQFMAGLGIDQVLRGQIPSGASDVELENALVATRAFAEREAFRGEVQRKLDLENAVLGARFSSIAEAGLDPLKAEDVAFFEQFSKDKLGHEVTMFGLQEEALRADISASRASTAASARASANADLERERLLLDIRSAEQEIAAMDEGMRNITVQSAREAINAELDLVLFENDKQRDGISDKDLEQLWNVAVQRAAANFDPTSPFGNKQRAQILSVGMSDWAQFHKKVRRRSTSFKLDRDTVDQLTKAVARGNPNIERQSTPPGLGFEIPR